MRTARSKFEFPEKLSTEPEKALKNEAILRIVFVEHTLDIVSLVGRQQSDV